MDKGISNYELDRAIISSKINADEKERFESLRLHFTSLFLQHPKMLEVLSYKDIVLKAKEFTKEYLKHE